jgi:hypothetical protein
MRVLHLLDGGRTIDGQSDAAASVCGRLLRERRDEHIVAVLGTRQFHRRAAGLGLETHFRLAPPTAMAALAWRGIRSAWRSGRAEVVCCWDRRAVAAALLTLGRDVPLVHIGAERLQMGGPLKPSRWESLGFDSMETPPVGAAPANVEDRESLRRSMRIGPGEVAALLLGASDDASAVRFAFTLGLARRAGEPVVGIIPAWADQTARARRYESRLTTGVRLIETRRPLARCLAAADLALWVGGGRSTTWLPQGRPSRLGVAECLSAGVPVVAPRGVGVEDLYPSEAAGLCLAEIGMPPELARRLFPLVLDPQRVKSIGALCREHWRGKDGTPDLAAAVSASCHRVSTTGGWGEVVVRQMAAAPHGA